MEEYEPKEVLGEDPESQEETNQLGAKVDAAGATATELYIKNMTTRPGWWW